VVSVWVCCFGFGCGCAGFVGYLLFVYSVVTVGFVLVLVLRFMVAFVYVCVLDLIGWRLVLFSVEC